MSVKALISFDVSGLEKLERDLVVLDAQTLNEMRRDTVNEVSLVVRKKAVDETIKQLNVTQDYVERLIEREEAKGGATIAYIRSGIRGTTLQRFGGGPIQMFKPVNWSNERIRERGFEVGPWPKWTPRIGDRARGIPVNFKQNGVSVAVKAGRPVKRIATAFTMPLRAGNRAGGNGVGVFRRNKTTGQIEHLYGPSVYQVFRSHILRNEQAIADDLRDGFLVRFDRATKDFTK